MLKVILNYRNLFWETEKTYNTVKQQIHFFFFAGIVL